jgi:N-acetylneuraminate synthase
MDKNDLKEFWRRWNFTEELLGSFKIKALADEEPARKNARRSLVAAKDIPEGKIIEAVDLTWKRPAHGISAKFYNDLIGKKSLRKIKEDEVLKWNLFN